MNKPNPFNDEVVVLAANSCLLIDNDNACLNLTLPKISLSYPASSRPFNAVTSDCNCNDATKSSGVKNARSLFLYSSATVTSIPISSISPAKNFNHAVFHSAIVSQTILSV